MLKKLFKKEITLRTAYRLFVIIPAGILAFLSVMAVIFLVSYAFTQSFGLLIALIVITLLSVAGYAVITFFIMKDIHRTFYDQIFSVTYNNIDKIRRNRVDLESYGESGIKEVQMLDEATRLIQEKLASSYLMMNKPDYSSLTLDYVDREKNLITFKSFRNNLANIIFLSQSYRNVVVEVYFSLPRSYVINNDDKNRILNLYLKAFVNHQNTLFMFGEDNKSLIIYLPVIDSFSEIREKLETVMVDSSIMIRDEKGIRNVPAQFAVVAYPYSTEDMILGDLKYARRQNKPYFLFLPKRFKDNSIGDVITNTTMNLNYMSKIVSELSNIDYSSSDNDENMRILNNVFNSFTDYLGVDEGGIIAFDNATKKHYPYVRSVKSTLFGNDVPEAFINALAKTIDDDQSYYFSTRLHANKEMANQLDFYGITSGAYYVIKGLENEEITAIVYLFNLGKDFVINSYLRETFYMMSLRIENYFEKKEIADYADELDEENENLLALSDYCTYRVTDDFVITKYSRNMKKVKKNIQKGEYCYKVFYDSEKPCIGCPLRTFKRRYVMINNKRYEVSTTLNDRKSVETTILVKPVNDNEEIDLFQKNFLIYSYHSLFDTLKNEYISSGRGFVCLLSIDNYDHLVEQKGGESYELVVRNFVRNIKNKLKIDDVYYYNPTTLAIHFPYVGHADIINRIENIYPLSKEDVKDDEFDDTLSVTYLVAGYPRGFANAEDFMKHMSDFYHSDDYEKNKDFIYFSDLSISRSASKRDFMISVLESEFGSHNSTSMNLQPIVRVKDRHIFGAEILIRIADAHRNVYFNANEISSLAQQEKKTYLITESIINFVGAMYKEYGNNIFKINNFNRIAINIDQTYLDDASLITEMVNLCKTNNLPNEFVSLEIPEDMIPHNIDGIKNLAKELSAYKIMFSCDRYLGEYIDIEQLKELGFTEVKVARDIIGKIDRDPVIYQELADIVTAAKNNGVRVAAVGVENEQQFKLLKDLDEDMMVQGYFLYRPLTRSDLISALISYEK